MPLPEYTGEQLFPSLDDLYKSTKSSFFKFLRSIRRAKVGAARGNRRREAVASATTGRNTRIVEYRKGRNRLAALQTILNAVSNGHYDLASREISINDRDMVGWKRLEYESLVLVLLVDVSKSTWPFIKVFKEVLASLTNYFNRHNDRIGLISLQGKQALIYSHPTHNFRVVARGLSRLDFHGETPLADGLAKSLSMAKLEKSKNPGSRSVVILLSDCYPEPITCELENKLDEPAYRNSINAAAPYKKAKVLLLVINPAFESAEGTLPGEVLSKRIADASGGKLIKLFRPGHRRHAPPSRKEMAVIMKGIEDSLSTEIK
ncbi:MAG: VWA domain-containing protein [Candidatus Zixiibacteriota bacterium]